MITCVFLFTLLCIFSSTLGIDPCGDDDGPTCQYNEIQVGDTSSNCAVISGGSCVNNFACVPNAKCVNSVLCPPNLNCAYSKRCACDRSNGYVEDVDYGTCLRTFGYPCNCTSDCSTGLTCSMNKCSCSNGQIWNPSPNSDGSMVQVYGNGGTSPNRTPDQGRCELDINARCNTADLGLGDSPPCTTNYCSGDSNRCECPPYSKYTTQGTCTCVMYTTYNSQTGYCDANIGASCTFSSGSWSCACPNPDWKFFNDNKCSHPSFTDAIRQIRR